MNLQPLSYMNAETRRQHLLAEAETERAIARAAAPDGRPTATVVATVRRIVGAALVQTGERLAGARDAGAELVLDAHPSAGVLRLAR